MSGNYVEYHKSNLLTLAKGEDACKVYRVAIQSLSNDVMELVPLEDYNVIVELYNQCIKGIINGKLGPVFNTEIFYTPGRFFD